MDRPEGVDVDVSGKRWVEGKEKSDREGWSETLRGRRRAVQASRMDRREASERRDLEDEVVVLELSIMESVTQTNERVDPYEARNYDT